MEILAKAGKETKRGLSVCQDIHSKQLDGLSESCSTKGIHSPSLWIFHLISTFYMDVLGGRAQAEALPSPATFPTLPPAVSWAGYVFASALLFPPPSALRRELHCPLAVQEMHL